MKITDLSDGDIRYIVNEIFEPKKIENIVRDEELESISCDITTTWEGGEGEDDFDTEDELVMYNPFSYRSPLHPPYSLTGDDIRKYRQLCVSLGVLPDWLSDNKYIRNLTFEMVGVKKEKV